MGTFTRDPELRGNRDLIFVGQVTMPTVNDTFTLMLPPTMKQAIIKPRVQGAAQIEIESRVLDDATEPGRDHAFHVEAANGQEYVIEEGILRLDFDVTGNDNQVDLTVKVIPKTL